jgi:glycosyltransferase involved in cell wall biosynthesis
VVCFPPDHYIGWLPFAYLAARRLLSQEAVDVIYTVSAPYTAHLVGWLLKKTTGKPWIADFRDEWTQNPTIRPMFSWQRKANRWLEQQSFDNADSIIIATESYKELMSSLAGPNLREKFTTITNSFDAEDFKPLDALPKGDKFKVVYCGSFYDMQQPAYFLAAMRSLVEEGLLPLDKISLTFAGYTRYNTREMFKDSLLFPAIRYMGIVSHKEAIQQMKEADVLLLIVGSLRGKENIPAKTFEYIATGKPILALVPPDGEAARVIRETRTGIVVAPEDVNAIKTASLDLYTCWRSAKLRIESNWEQINRYEAREVTRQLSIVLDGLMLDQPLQGKT